MVANHQATISETVYPKPTGYGYLNWVIQGHWQAEYGGCFSSEKSTIFFAGQIKDTNITVTQTGVFKHIVAEFSALGFYQLTGIRGIDCRNRSDTPDSFKPHLGLLFGEFLKQTQQLAKSVNLDEHLRLLEAFLLTLADKPHAVPDYLTEGTEKIEKANGFVSIEKVCQNLDISQRQFNRRFTEIVGLSPKYFARVLQMNKALRALLENDRNYLSHIANAAGYYDESHFIRVIQDFFSSSPSQFLNSNQETLFTFLRNTRGFIEV